MKKIVVLCLVVVLSICGYVFATSEATAAQQSVAGPNLNLVGSTGDLSNSGGGLAGGYAGGFSAGVNIKVAQY